MSRLIDADALSIKFNEKCVGECCCCRFATTTTSGCRVIDDAPEIDPVKHGHWEVVDESEPRRYGCSVCKKLSWTEDNYCSYCGAKMNEVEDE